MTKEEFYNLQVCDVIKQNSNHSGMELNYVVVMDSRYREFDAVCSITIDSVDRLAAVRKINVENLPAIIEFDCLDDIELGYVVSIYTDLECTIESAEAFIVTGKSENSIVVSRYALTTNPSEWVKVN